MTPTYVHRWDITTEDGKMVGRCRHCPAVKVYPNLTEVVPVFRLDTPHPTGDLVPDTQWTRRLAEDMERDEVEA